MAAEEIKSFVSEKIKTLVDEGKDKDQATAIAISKAREKFGDAAVSAVYGKSKD